MNSKKQSLKLKIYKLCGAIAKFRRYSFVMFIIFIAALYGFILLRINSLSQAEPSAEAVTNQVKAAQVPHIDKKVVAQLESLKDNSVSVKALFDQARSNPFQ